MRSIGPVLTEDLFNPSDLPVCEPNLYSVRMIRRLRQQISNDALCKSARPLIFFQDDGDLHSGLYIGSSSSVHNYS